ncbi:MAG: HAMP domain-containing protein, partial [Actinobacteria bacterium]|nr:HAMP domain-containing protein [Actinomycetota bacterium]
AKNVTGDVASQIDHQRSSAVRSATLYLFAGGLVIVAAIAAAIWISRSITGRLVKLTGAADRLSHEQLPRLVDSLKNPAEDDVGYLTSSFAEIEVTGSDEIGQLAGAFNRIQSVAVSVATEQAQLLRKGIGDMFVNLARRNQGLLDRQIEFIDQLESAEEDPDQLENLFRLDHLATRMRRNAESLLVLAGAEPSRRRGKPVPLADVVRAAVGEVEDFARVDMLQFDEVLVASNAALDIAHLLSELMENATNFSPPDTRVEVVGHRTKAEGYVISVTDHGIGIAPEALAEANDLLARPPLVGLALSRSLGYIVIGRLAARFGIAVRLMPSPSSGTTAMVSLPPSLITDQPRTPTEPAAINTRERTDIPPASEDPSALAEGTDRRPPARRRSPAATGPQALPTRGEGKATTGPSAMPRRTAVKAVPDSPTAAPTKTRTPAAKSEAPVAAGADSTTTEAGSAPSTDAGLTKRVPRRAGGQRAVPGGDGSRSATQNRRSPEEVRSMLSNYRSGMQKGRTDDSPTKPEDDRK